MACGFCRQSSCPIHLKKKNNQPESDFTCTHPFSLAPAAKFTTSSPCTNHPMPCTLCPLDDITRLHPAIWKYNFPEHLATCHSAAGQAIPLDLAAKIEISDEEVQAITGKQLKGPRKRKSDGGGSGKAAKKRK
jgi:hypothetical protein